MQVQRWDSPVDVPRGHSSRATKRPGALKVKADNASGGGVAGNVRPSRAAGVPLRLSNRHPPRRTVPSERATVPTTPGRNSHRMTGGTREDPDRTMPPHLPNWSDWRKIFLRGLSAPGTLGAGDTPPHPPTLGTVHRGRGGGAVQASKGQVWTRHCAPAAAAFAQPSLPSQFPACVTASNCSIGSECWLGQGTRPSWFRASAPKFRSVWGWGLFEICEERPFQKSMG